MIKCCLEHVELAIDMIVDKYEVAPKITKVTKEEELSTSCEFCQNKSIYIVEN